MNCSFCAVVCAWETLSLFRSWLLNGVCSFQLAVRVYAVLLLLGVGFWSLFLIVESTKVFCLPTFNYIYWCSLNMMKIWSGDHPWSFIRKWIQRGICYHARIKTLQTSLAWHSWMVVVLYCINYVLREKYNVFLRGHDTAVCCTVL